MAPTPARDRLVATADRLFYRHGLRAVGIDRVIAEAGVAKATLYAHFPTKDDLIVAVLRHREAELTTFLTAARDRHAAAGADPLGAFFAALKDWFRSDGFRGCAFLNAAVELADPDHPGSEYVRGYRRRFRALLAGLVRPAGKAALPALLMLVDGAIMAALLDGSPAAADTALAAARRLLGGAG